MIRPAGAHPVLALSLAFVLQACSDAVPTSVAPLHAPGFAASHTASAAEADSAIMAVARGVAVTLATPKFRRKVLEDLRDSPFSEHGIHLKSYLRGQHGREFAAAVAAATGQSVDQFQIALDRLPELEMLVPLAADRVRWQGSDDLVVVGTTARRDEIMHMRSLGGYDARTGAPTAIPIGVSLRFPLLLIAPAEIDFGPEPENTRTSAPKKSRSTIGTAETEYQLDGSYSESCDETVRWCDPPVSGGGPPEGGLVIPSGYTYQCFENVSSATDRDADGILDSCEAEIAYAFRPYLQGDSRDTYPYRETYWSAKRSGTYEVRVFYAFGYLWDDGTDINFDDVGDHAGDSEFVVFTIAYHGGKWRFVRAFLSAHYHKLSWDASSTREYDVFNYPSGVYRTRPKVWVAVNKHANYHSQSKCDEGANYFDSCDAPRADLDDFEIAPEYNLGNNESGVRLLNCVASRGGPANPLLLTGRSECFWDGGPTSDSFRGWGFRNSSTSASAGPYKDALGDFDF